MPPKTDKITLKQYFRSGSRPTQKQFHDLIDSCYNGDLSSAASGYEVLVDTEINRTIFSMKRAGGRTYIIPFFERINMPDTRVYHYAIPVCNVGGGHKLERVTIAMTLPQTANYKVKDRNKELNIRQSVKLREIRIHNGAEEIHTVSSEIESRDSLVEISIGKGASRWLGIGIDITVDYDIKSDIAVSDQFNIGAQSEEMLLHTFGNVECFFISDGEPG